MLSVEERLEDTDGGFPAHAVDPSASLARVVRRGRLTLALARIGAGLVTTAVVAAGVVAVPRLVAPPSPEVVSPVIEPTVDEAAHDDRKPDGAREEPAPDRPSDLTFVPDRPVEGVAADEPAKEEPVHEDPVAPKPEPDPQPTKEPEPDHEEPAAGFTANQEFGHVEHDPPYNKYHGEAAPGTEIWAGNDHGSASTVADEKGNWYAKVWFEDAPYGTHTFTVVVETSDGHRQTFEMTATRPEPKSEEPVSHFTANQKWEASDDDPPSNVYWGTAEPNTQVNVMSEYGSIETMTDASGDWETTLVFQKAPAGTTTFTVKVRSLATGEYQLFEMTTHRPT